MAQLPALRQGPHAWRLLQGSLYLVMVSTVHVNTSVPPGYTRCSRDTQTRGTNRRLMVHELRSAAVSAALPQTLQARTPALRGSATVIGRVQESSLSDYLENQTDYTPDSRPSATSRHTRHNGGRRGRRWLSREARRGSQASRASVALAPTVSKPHGEASGMPTDRWWFRYAACEGLPDAIRCPRDRQVLPIHASRYSTTGGASVAVCEPRPDCRGS